MSLVACPDGRQLLMIMKTSKKDTGICECVASNNLASATTSCILSIACKLKRLLIIQYSINAQCLGVLTFCSLLYMPNLQKFFSDPYFVFISHFKVFQNGQEPQRFHRYITTLLWCNGNHQTPKFLARTHLRKNVMVGNTVHLAYTYLSCTSVLNIVIFLKVFSLPFIVCSNLKCHIFICR